jgi:DNA-binding response OmpR family regulator
MNRDEAQVSAGAGTRLLLVEDDRDQLVPAARLLQAAGFTVDIARTAAEALRKVHRLRPDIIVTDVVIPDVSGEDLVRQLRASPKLRDIPVVVYTAQSDVHTLARLVRLGVRVFLIKPCLPSVISAEAHALLLTSPSAAPVRVLTGYGDTLTDLARQLDGP